MNTPSPFVIASAVLTAPGWVRVRITAPSARLREEAALALADRIMDCVETPPTMVSEGQMPLPL